MIHHDFSLFCFVSMFKSHVVPEKRVGNGDKGAGFFLCVRQPLCDYLPWNMCVHDVKGSPLCALVIVYDFIRNKYNSL